MAFGRRDAFQRIAVRRQRAALGCALNKFIAALHGVDQRALARFIVDPCPFLGIGVGAHAGKKGE